MGSPHGDGATRGSAHVAHPAEKRLNQIDGIPHGVDSHPKLCSDVVLRLYHAAGTDAKAPLAAGVECRGCSRASRVAVSKQNGNIGL